MDREDIHALVMKLNDILDLVWSTADKTVVFQLNTSRMDAVELAKLVDEFTDNSIRCCINKIKD